MFDLESKYCFHLRITGTREKCIEAVTAFKNKWCPMAAITGFEKSQKEVEHCHTHIQFDYAQHEYHMASKGKTARSEFFKKLDLSGKYNFDKVVKMPIDNLKYCLKDDDIIYQHNVNAEQLQQIKNMVIEVKESMKMETRDKLLNLYKEHLKTMKDFLSKFDDPGFTNGIRNPVKYTAEDVSRRLDIQELSYIARFIHNVYINQWSKEPPLSHLKGYVLYIAEKVDEPNLNYKQCIKAYYEKMFI